MTCDWVIGRAIGDRAKSIIEHANAGIGYFLLDQGRQGNQATCLYAFSRPTDSPVPEHLTVVKDFTMISKLDKRRDARFGTDRKPQLQQTTLSNPETMNNIKATLDKRKAAIKETTS